MKPHYEKRVVHGKEMLVKVYPMGFKKGASNNSRFKRRHSSADGQNSIAEATARTKYKFRPKPRIKKKTRWAEKP